MRAHPGPHAASHDKNYCGTRPLGTVPGGHGFAVCDVDPVVEGLLGELGVVVEELEGEVGVVEFGFVGFGFGFVVVGLVELVLDPLCVPDVDTQGTPFGLFGEVGVMDGVPLGVPCGVVCWVWGVVWGVVVEVFGVVFWPAACVVIGVGGPIVVGGAGVGAAAFGGVAAPVGGGAPGVAVCPGVAGVPVVVVCPEVEGVPAGGAPAGAVLCATTQVAQLRIKNNIVIRIFIKSPPRS